jgi:hypothetical protein
MAKATIEPGEPGNIIQIISTIAKEAGVLGKTKPGGVPFEFRGIDATINHLAEHLDAYGVIQTSRVISKDTEFRAFLGSDGKPNGKGITQTDIVVEYTFWAPDGSYLTTEAAGLAQDHADRCAAQAQSVALRVALLQLFHLPTSAPEPEVAGEETQRVIGEQASARAASKPAAAKAAPSYRTKIAELIGDASNTIEGADANVALKEASGLDAPDKWTEAHMKAAYEALVVKAAS